MQRCADDLQDLPIVWWCKKYGYKNTDKTIQYIDNYKQLGKRFNDIDLSDIGKYETDVIKKFLRFITLTSLDFENDVDPITADGYVSYGYVVVEMEQDEIALSLKTNINGTVNNLKIVR